MVEMKNIGKGYLDDRAFVEFQATGLLLNGDPLHHRHVAVGAKS